MGTTNGGALRGGPGCRPLAGRRGGAGGGDARAPLRPASLRGGRGARVPAEGIPAAPGKVPSIFFSQSAGKGGVSVTQAGPLRLLGTGVRAGDGQEIRAHEWFSVPAAARVIRGVSPRALVACAQAVLPPRTHLTRVHAGTGCVPSGTRLEGHREAFSIARGPRRSPSVPPGPRSSSKGCHGTRGHQTTRRYSGISRYADAWKRRGDAGEGRSPLCSREGKWPGLVLGAAKRSEKKKKKKVWFIQQTVMSSVKQQKGIPGEVGWGPINQLRCLPPGTVVPRGGLCLRRWWRPGLSSDHSGVFLHLTHLP